MSRAKTVVVDEPIRYVDSISSASSIAIRSVACSSQVGSFSTREEAP
nr:hypothetical protein [Streptomyces sp. HB202]